MNPSRKLTGPMVSAAIALIAVTNYCIIHIVGVPSGSAAPLVSRIWPIALPSSVAVILVMSTLYHLFDEVVGELEHKRDEALEQAGKDPLTSVANKSAIEGKIEEAIARHQRTGEKFAVLMLDLDHFKRVNDLLGHQVGDLLLQRTAALLQASVREIDIVARFGGDEFIILQTDVSGPDEARRLCARIARKMAEPQDVGGREMSVGTSLGAVVTSPSLHHAFDYLRAADVAMYAAKAKGRGCFHLYSDQLDESLKRRDILERDLRKSLKSGDGIYVEFQPQIRADGEVAGAETLFRWNHTELGAIPALEAISIAEECQLIDELGQFVFGRAIDFAKDRPWLSVSVNLSAAQFARAANLPEQLLKIAARRGVKPCQLELEVTEKLFIDAGSECEEQLKRLRKYGFRLALDDFGTGYSSLSHLRRFAVDRLKLHRSFFGADPQESVVIARAAVTLAHTLDLDVVAEGIESSDQQAIALEAGCDTLQGNLYAAPMNASEFDEFIGKNRRAAA